MISSALVLPVSVVTNPAVLGDVHSSFAFLLSRIVALIVAKPKAKPLPSGVALSATTAPHIYFVCRGSPTAHI